jgi:hypothetical protein
MNIQILGILIGILFLIVSYLQWKCSYLSAKVKNMDKILGKIAHSNFLNAACMRDISGVLYSKGIINDKDFDEYYKSMEIKEK